jgi:hypothetical protein
MFGDLLTPYLIDISYGDEVTPGILKGVQGIDLATTRGFYKANLSMTMYMEGFVILLKQLPEGYSEKVFPITCTYFQYGQTPIIDKLPQNRILKIDKAFRNSDTGGLPIRIGLYTQLIEQDGKCLYRRYG